MLMDFRRTVPQAVTEAIAAMSLVEAEKRFQVHRHTRHLKLTQAQELRKSRRRKSSIRQMSVTAIRGFSEGVNRAGDVVKSVLLNKTGSYNVSSAMAMQERDGAAPEAYKSSALKICVSPRRSIRLRGWLWNLNAH